MRVGRHSPFSPPSWCARLVASWWLTYTKLETVRSLSLMYVLPFSVTTSWWRPNYNFREFMARWNDMIYFSDHRCCHFASHPHHSFITQLKSRWPWTKQASHSPVYSKTSQPPALLPSQETLVSACPSQCSHQIISERTLTPLTCPFGMSSFLTLLGTQPTSY